jgi:hypothetical protein
MYLIFNTHSSNEHYNGDCDCALVELTPALAEQILGRVALARQAGQQDNDLCELYFWGSTAEFYDSNLIDACAEATAAHGSEEAASKWLSNFEDAGYALVPIGVDLAAHESQRIELSQMIVRCSPSSHRPEFEVCWTASPKHSDVYVTTRDLPLKRLEELLAAEHRPDSNPSNARTDRTCLS